MTRKGVKKSKLDNFFIKSNETYKELNPILLLLVFVILFAMIPTGLKYTMNFNGELELTSKFTLILVGVVITLCKLFCISAAMGRMTHKS